MAQREELGLTAQNRQQKLRRAIVVANHSHIAKLDPRVLVIFTTIEVGGQTSKENVLLAEASALECQHGLFKGQEAIRSDVIDTKNKKLALGDLRGGSGSERFDTCINRMSAK